MRPVWIKGNQVDLLESGQEFFPSLLNEIENAQTEIILFTYIFKNDRIGTEVGKRLKSAALRNVAVTLVIDGFGSGNLPVNFIEDLRNSKVQILVFRAFHRIFSLRKLFFRRLHQKIVVIDQKIAFVGGINIDGDQYEQLDYALRVSGPVVIKIYKFAKLLI
ncbi:MAG: clsB [Bacteriovoracaceae bacterium]|nr:clsB [Bacteriovoracaceae bacterium]